MKEIKETTYKGTRILLGNEKRSMINNMITYLISKGYTEISIPIIQYQEIFKNKVGEENNNLMFNFIDRGNRELCLTPEVTSVVQKLTEKTFKYQKDVKLFYIHECFRGEKPQAGRYRQFTQLGVEIINPTKDYLNELITNVEDLLKIGGLTEFIVNRDVIRGLDYYEEGIGFEVVCETLGNAKQICGGGKYEGGIGFAIGIDRLISINNYQQK